MKTGIVVFAGQSNMVGYRSDISALTESTKDAEIPYCVFNNDSTSVPMGNSAGDYGILRPLTISGQDAIDTAGTGWTGSGTLPSGVKSWGYGPEMSMCRELHTSTNPIAAVKWAIGGQSLEGTFNPSPAGFGYTALKSYMTGMQSALSANGVESYFKAFVWWQGEEDSENTGQYENYFYNIKRLIAHVRSIAKNENLPFIIVKTTTPSAAEGISDVQSAQELAASSINNVFIYDPSGLSLYSDNVHYHLDSMVVAGNEIADIVAGV